MSGRYWLETHKIDGTFVSKLPFYNLQFETGFNGPTGIRWNTPLYEPRVSQATLAPGLHEVYVMRNGVCVAAGPIWSVTASSNDRTLTCSANTLEDYFNERLLQDVNYSAIDQVNIAWGMISDSQARTGGALGITSGILGTGITRSADFATSDGKYILEAIQDMSAMANGFDFYIEPATRKFNAIYPRLQTQRNLTLTYPAHISSYAIEYYGDYLRNRVVVKGPDPTWAVAIDTTTLATYGLREYSDSYTDAVTANDLTDYTSKLRDIRASVKNYPTLVLRTQYLNPFDGFTINYGDLVHIIIQDGYVSIDAVLRYGGCQVTVNNAGEETIVLYMQDQRELT